MRQTHHIREKAARYVVLLMRTTEMIAASLLVVVVLMNLAQVFFRYVIVDPLSWSEESMRYVTTWMVMIAGAPALLRNEHMVVSLFDSARSPALRQFARILVQVCVAGFCLLLMWEGYPAAIDNMRQVSPAMRVPMTVPYLAIPVGATLLLINVVAQLTFEKTLKDALPGSEAS